MKSRWLAMLVLSVTAIGIVLLNAGTASAGKPKPPHIVLGADHETAAVFSYANAIRERVFIPVPGVDQDGDGVIDRVAIDIIRPAETNQGMKVPAIIDPSPYYTSVGRGNETQYIHTTPAGNLDQLPLFYDNYFVPRGYAVILGRRGRHGVLDRLPAARRARRPRRVQGRDRLAERPHAGSRQGRQPRRRDLAQRQERDDRQVVRRHARQRRRRDRRRRA